MGNVNGHEAYGPMQNDPNNPDHRQMRGVVLYGLIPLAGICLFAYTAKKHNDEKEALKQQHDYTVAKLENELERKENTCNDEKEALKQQYDYTVDKLMNELQRKENTYWSTTKKHNDEKEALKQQHNYTVAKLMNELERKESTKFVAKLNELDNYDMDIEKILDIRYNPFRNKEQRIEIQNKLLDNSTKPGSHLQDLHMDCGLKEIFKYDYLFFGNIKEENRKLSKIYLEHWKLKAECQYYKNIVERLKTNLGVGEQSK